VKPELNSGLGVFINLIIPIIALFNSNKVEKQKHGNFVLNLDCIYIWTYLLVVTISIFSRLKNGLIFIPILSIGMLSNIKTRCSKILCYSLLFIYFILFLKTIGAAVGPGTAMYSPYSSIFDK
jgi:hypothetical protein